MRLFDRDTDAILRLEDETLVVPTRAADAELDRLTEAARRHPDGAGLYRRLSRPREREILRDRLVRRAARTFVRDRAFANRLRAHDGEQALARAMRGWLAEMVRNHPIARTLDAAEPQLEEG